MNTLHEQVQAGNVQAHYKEALHAPLDDHSLELVEMPSLPDRLPALPASSSDGNENLRGHEMSRQATRSKSKVSSSISFQNHYSLAPSLNKSCCSISVPLSVNGRLRTALDYQVYKLDERSSINAKKARKEIRKVP